MRVSLGLRTYFCCIAAPGGSCAAHVLAVQPFGALLAAFVRLHLVLADGAGWRRSSANLSLSEDEFDHSRRLNDGVATCQRYEGLVRIVSSVLGKQSGIVHTKICHGPSSPHHWHGVSS